MDEKVLGNIAGGRKLMYLGDALPGGPPPEQQLLVVACLNGVWHLEGPDGTPFDISVEDLSGPYHLIEERADPATQAAAFDRFMTRQFGDPLPVVVGDELVRNDTPMPDTYRVPAGFFVTVSAINEGVSVELTGADGVIRYTVNPALITDKYFSRAPR